MTPQPGQSLSAEDCKLLFGLDPDNTGNRPRSWNIVDEAESAELATYGYLSIPPGSLCVHTRDGASNPICVEACTLPNFIGTNEDDFDRTYRNYFYAPLERPAPSVEGLGALRPEDRAFVPTEREDGPSDRRQADAALAELGRGLAKDLSAGHYAMSDAVQMIEALSERLAALSASGPAGGGGEAFEALAAELAEERYHAERQAHEECGVTEYDGTIDDQMPDARDFVRRCAALSAPGSQKGAGE